MAARDGDSAGFTTSVADLGREADQLRCRSVLYALLDPRSVVGSHRVVALAPLAIQPSHFADRSNTGRYSVRHPCLC